MPLRLARPTSTRLASLLLALTLATALPLGAEAQVTPFTRSISEAASRDEALSAFYRDRGYRTLWTGPEDAARRSALLTALARAGDHGLPVQRYDAAALIAAFREADTEGDRGRLEVAMTRALVAYAHDLQSGVLNPGKVDSGIKREVIERDPLANLAAFERDPLAFLHALPPQDPEYARLVKEKIRLEQLIRSGGWGASLAETALKPGATGPALIALRDRLMAMGYLGRTASSVYDDTIRAGVEQFQRHHGLEADGLAGPGTIAEINVGPEARLKSVLVALERQRWMNFDRGARHVWVNLADFQSRIIDDGKVTFETRSVIGKDVPDQRSPEFSDEMEYMVINPSWNVPRSITTKEYLPLMQRNPNAASHLMLVDRNGRAVNRGSINFNAYNARNFPYSMRQPPSDGNALGLVKFMFPNEWNIYLHDTPSKSLFDRQDRAFSHGCVRLADPFDFAYALLAPQSADPEGEFQALLKTGRESVVRLEQPVPVHLVYFTASSTARGQMNYRRDVYGRDGVIYEALSAAGVVLGPLQG